MARSITIYRTTYFDTYDGELVDPDTFEDSTECEPDEWDVEEGLSAVDLAVKALTEESITSPSTMPGFHTGIWYQYIDGSYCSNHYTGEQTQLSGHLVGFTEDEERLIHKGVMDAYADIFGAQYRVA